MADRFVGMTRQVVAGFKILTSAHQVKALLVNIFGARARMAQHALLRVMLHVTTSGRHHHACSAEMCSYFPGGDSLLLDSMGPT